MLDDTRLRTGVVVKLTGPEDFTLTALGRAELILVNVPVQFQPVGVWAVRQALAWTRRFRVFDDPIRPCQAGADQRRDEAGRRAAPSAEWMHGARD